MSANSFMGSKVREDDLLLALAQELQPSLEKSASAETGEGESTQTVLASVISTLVKCADKLDSVGHPAADKVDSVLAFIEAELFSKEAEEK